MQYKQARDIGLSICKKLDPFTTFCSIAGSVRREKPEVKDLEIVCLPRVNEVSDLFGEVLSTERSKGFISEVMQLGIIGKGDPKTGRYCQIMLPDGINLDLFIPVESDWARQYAIRTGSAEYAHKVLAVAWLRQGWCGTEDGLRLQTESYQKKVGEYPDGRDKFKWVCSNPEPTLPPVFNNEMELFSWLQIPWIEPSKRYV
jgi:DNA polymerase/3'-5' exonuclease PolX